MRLSSLWMILALTAGGGIPLLTAGCEPSAAPNAPPLTGSAGAGAIDAANPAAAESSAVTGVWPFWPVRMQFHPLTRIVTDENSGAPAIEARLEFRDAQDVRSKAAGQMTIQIFDAAAATKEQQAEPLKTWNQDLNDLTVNTRQFDGVMLAYLFRLEVDLAQFPQEPQLRAFFLSADGRKLEATVKLRR